MGLLLRPCRKKGSVLTGVVTALGSRLAQSEECFSGQGSPSNGRRPALEMLDRKSATQQNSPTFQRCLARRIVALGLRFRQ
jgi:hypothetical protein